MYRILDKVRNTTTSQCKPNTTPTEENKMHSENGTSLVPYLSKVMAVKTKNFTQSKRKQMKNDIADMIFDRFILRGDDRIVKYYNPEEKILEARQKAIAYRVGGISVLGGAAGGLAVASWGGMEVGTTLVPVLVSSAVIGTGILAPLALVLGGIITIGCGIFFGYKLLKKGSSLMREPEIRQCLNKKMQDALSYFNKKEFENFFKTIALPYASKPGKGDLQLIEFVPGKFIAIQPKSIVHQLLKHEFRPDGIAYLLNIIGEVLVRRVIVLKDKTQSALSELAIEIFEEIFSSQELKDEAMRLDNVVKNARLNKDKQEKILQRMYGWLKRKFAENYYSIPSEWLKAAEQAPFTARLEEMRNIARINFATCQIIAGREDNLQRASEIINQVKASLAKKFQFFGAPDLRIKALQDWLFALGCYDDPEQKSTSQLALTETIRAEELQRIQNVQIEKMRLSIQLFVAVSEGADLWEYVFHFLNELQIFSREEFVKIVKRSYQCEPRFQTMMSKIFEDQRDHQCIDNVEKWCSGFLTDDHIFHNRYLQVIAFLLRVEFQHCQVIRKGESESIFEAYGAPISPPEHVCILRRIYLVVDHSTRETVLGLFATHDSTYLRYNLERAKMETDIATKVQKLLQIALIYREEAELCNASNHIVALSKWAEQLEIYDEVRKFAPLNQVALLGSAKCLLMLHKYKRAEDFLMQHKTSLHEHVEFWTVLAVAQCRQFNKKTKAIQSINQALEIQPESSEAARQRSLIEGEIRSMMSREYAYKYNLDTRCSRSSTKNPTYNILSIDGGGVRGILPTVWLCELERKTRRPITTMFDMISGTSTGGIIAAALSMPSVQNSNLLNNRMQDLQLQERGQPQYTASEVLKLYTTNHKELFTSNTFSFGGVARSKYSDSGRRNLFNQYYQNVHLANALTDLVIPAVCLQTQAVYSFTKRAPENHRLFDAVMATTSAPTCFSPYEINERSFVDGGVQANNPTMLAYDEAIKYGVQHKNVFVLSLGTGDYIPDPIHPGASRNLLFWYSKLMKPDKIIFDGPQNNLERHMRDLLQENYHRWQVWFENPIKLDDCRKETLEYLIDTAREYIEELEGCDSKARLGLVIEHLVEG